MATVTKPEVEPIDGKQNEFQLRVTNLGMKLQERTEGVLNPDQAKDQLEKHSISEAKDGNKLWDWIFKSGTKFQWKPKHIPKFYDAAIIKITSNKIHFGPDPDSREKWEGQIMGLDEFVKTIQGERIRAYYILPIGNAADGIEFKSGYIYGKINKPPAIMAEDKKLEMVPKPRGENNAKFSYENYYDNRYYDAIDLQQQSNVFMDNDGYDINVNGGYNQQQQLLSPPIILPVQYGINNNNNGHYISQEWLAVILPMLLIGACLFGMICVILMGFGGLFCYRQGQEAGGEDDVGVIYKSLPRKPGDGNKGNRGLIHYDEYV